MCARLSTGVVCAALVVLLIPAVAGAVSAAPKVVAAATWIAGHPVTVACDADVNPSPFPSPPGYTATAWTYTGGTVIHAMPTFCADTHASPGSPDFAIAIDVFIHEAARARGFSDNSCVELVADLGVYDVLRRFFGVPFFSPLSRAVGAEVLALTRTLPPIYQPEACWASGQLR